MTSPPGEAQEASAVASASMTDVGQIRAANEDSCDVIVRADGAHLLVVADGMGGHRGGATASSAVVATIAEVFRESASGSSSEPNTPRAEQALAVRPNEPPSSARMLQAAIQAANARVYAMAQQDPALEGMGSTVVALLLRPDLRATVAHVGDSRAYRLRQGAISPITMDHSVVAEMQRQGLLTAQEASIHPRRNEILRSVGVLPQVEIDVAEVEVRPGDLFLLCSDGLSGVVSDEEMAAIVQAEPPDAAVQSLIRLANERGGPDNITVQILAISATALVGTDPEATADVEISSFGMEQIQAMRRTRGLRRYLALAIALAALCATAYCALGPFAADPKSAIPIDSARPSSDVPQDVSPDALPSQAGASSDRATESAQREPAETSESSAESPMPMPPMPPTPQAQPSPGQAPSASGVLEQSTPAGKPSARPAELETQDQFEIDRPAPRRGVPRNDLPAT